MIVTIIFARKRKVSFPLMADTISMGLLIGQIMGRWGNFFNREAFGEYTDSIFAMCIPVDYFSENASLNGLVSSGVITQKMAENVVTIDGMHWISVHPTFLYESMWNLALLVIIMVYRKYKKFDGSFVFNVSLGLWTWTCVDRGASNGLPYDFRTKHPCFPASGCHMCPCGIRHTCKEAHGLCEGGFVT